MSTSSFVDAIASLAESTLRGAALGQKGPVRIVTHMDCDGLCAMAVLRSLFARTGHRHESVIVESPHDALLHLGGDASLVILCDIGSSLIADIEKAVAARDAPDVFIIDHHIIPAKNPAEPKSISSRIRLLNPNSFGLDGGREISSAGIAYHVACAIDPNCVDLAHIALIGALGDAQEEKGGVFRELNAAIVDSAVASGRLSVLREPRLFGLRSRSLIDVLAARSDLFIPSVTGIRHAARRLVESVIEDASRASSVRYDELSAEEQGILIDEIVSARSHLARPDDIFGISYVLTDEDRRSPLCDCREFSSILNACGRMGEGDVGIKALLGDTQARSRARLLKDAYKQEITQAFFWLSENKGTSRVVDTEEYLFVDAGETVRPTVLGTVASIIAKSTDTRENKIIAVIGKSGSASAKVSLRVAGRPTAGPDVYSLLRDCTDGLGGSFGGHRYAAGAVIPLAGKEEFITRLKTALAGPLLDAPPTE